MAELDKEKMPEAEVSLRLAFHLINKELVNSDVSVSIDGSQIKTNEKIHFHIEDFLKREGWIQKNQPSSQPFYGLYRKSDCNFGIEITSTPGIGDVTAKLDEKRKIRVECKKGSFIKSSSNPEYRLLREAFGQILTVKDYSDSDLLAVAIPKSDKFIKLKDEWQNAPLIKKLGIQILLVDRENNVEGLELKNNV